MLRCCRCSLYLRRLCRTLTIAVIMSAPAAPGLAAAEEHAAARVTRAHT